MSEVASALLWFIAVIASIPLVLWLLRRSPLAASRGHAVMRSVGVLPLSNAQRVVTIEVGHGEARRWLVLGVTAHSINTLHTMEPQADAAPTATPGATFAQLLGRLRDPGTAARSDDGRH